MANLSIGIVGLPNVGKSTLFNALLKKTVAYAANYPFATIEPNVGIVEVPDKRLAELAKVANTQTLVPAAVEFYDIAGLVRGASQGEGLGNKFLAHIREVAAITHVVRLFESGDIIHVEQTPDALRDIQTIETELILADLSTLEKQREPKGAASKDEKAIWEVVQKLKSALDSGKPARSVELTDEEKPVAKQLQLLSAKPVIFAFNVSEEQLSDQDSLNKIISEVLEKSDNKNSDYLYLNAKLENEVLALPEEEQKEYLQTYGLEETGLNRLIQEAYKTLGLISYLTAGEKEVRAWTITRGMLAPQAAGVIHTDFEKKFIKADIVQYADFIAAPGWVKAREKGMVQTVGRDYVMKDGEVVEFKIGA